MGLIRICLQFCRILEFKFADAQLIAMTIPAQESLSILRGRWMLRRTKAIIADVLPKKRTYCSI